MTKTFSFLTKYLPRCLAYMILYGWYTFLLLLIIAYSSISPVNFIYWGH